MATTDRRPRHYTSRTRLLGLPLVCICKPAPDEIDRPRRVAKGWIAMGDVAVGLFALGGVAIGGIALGGVSIGLVSIGGLAIGGIALAGAAIGAAVCGGAAIGGFTWGGAAVGYAATGGTPIGVYAAGSTAIGTHIWTQGSPPDPAAMQFFDRFAWYFGNPPFGTQQPVITCLIAAGVIAALALVLMIALLIAKSFLSVEASPFDDLV